MYSSVSFEKYTHVCNYYYNQGIEYFYHLKQILGPFHPPSSYFQATIDLFFYHCDVVLPTLEFHIKRIIHYALFSA